ncbi:MAG: cytochrome c oxidase assembly factor CtaG [Bacilli bacterium]|jgi:putative membrane protein|uniref:Cytochrome c oxidase assembly factor CtaG n=1 Tax=Ureibacillus suwonensis TaxID=313007 RepID=A0ABW0RAQ9_9BACL|nr:cytochrome c oxidase assembly factor CtaG [Bacilli bacterium]
MPLSIFGFQAMWSPYMIGTLVFIIIVYFLVTIRWRSDFKGNEPLKKKEAVYFILGIILLYIVKGSPIDLLSNITFTMHMVQMAFYLLLIPILIIKGIPWWVWRVVVEFPVVDKIVKALTHPVVSVLGFALTFSVYHLPIVFDYIKIDETLHGLASLALFLSAFFMYWPLVNEVPGQRKIKGLYKIGYIIATAVVITPACALIIFTKNPVYATYTDGEAWLKAMSLCVPDKTLASLNTTVKLSGPELFTNLSPLRDQQLGGVLMKIIQEIILGVILYFAFREWWSEEHKLTEEEITAKALNDFQEKKRNQY